MDIKTALLQLIDHVEVQTDPELKDAMDTINEFVTTRQESKELVCPKCLSLTRRSNSPFARYLNPHRCQECGLSFYTEKFAHIIPTKRATNTQSD